MDEQLAVTKAPAVQTYDALHALVQAKEAEREQLHETYTALWQQRKTATLDDMGYVRYMRTEDRMALLLEELDDLRPQRDAARVRETVLAAQQHHDAAVPEALDLATRAVEATRTAAQLWSQLAATFDAQTTPLMAYQDRHGIPAFTGPNGGAPEAGILFQALFEGDSRAAAAFGLLTHPTSVKPHALTACPRLKPLEPRTITTYLNTITTGVTPNGSH